jgi:hypothetical protein
MSPPRAPEAGSNSGGTHSVSVSGPSGVAVLSDVGTGELVAVVMASEVGVISGTIWLVQLIKVRTARQQKMRKAFIGNLIMYGCRVILSLEYLYRMAQ